MMVVGENVNKVNNEEKRVEIDIRDILTQMGIPPQKWPIDIIEPTTGSFNIR
ncbi:MAG: hypothetical protein ACE3L7_08935 [Candidatus Pristimantibacillus sp.]